MEQNRTKRPTLATACIEAYDKLRASTKPGKPYELERLTPDELTGLYLSVAIRHTNRQRVSCVEKLAILELIGDAGMENWRRIFGADLIDLSMAFNKREGSDHVP